MALKRRYFLLFLGASAGTITLGSCFPSGQKKSGAFTPVNPNTGDLGFQPVKSPLPLNTDPMPSTKQVEAYSRYEVVDDLVLPEGFTYDVISAWGDQVGDSRFGYNNDYLSFIETGEDEGYLTINFEYISGGTWMQTYAQVIGESLPFEEVTAVAAKSEGKINAFALPDNNPLKAKIRQISLEGLIDQGLGVISIHRNADGRWTRTYSAVDRRITGISGLEDDRYLKATGPAVAIFRKTQGQGYSDGLGDRIIGTFQNCAGGTTPWGTVFSAEENFQDQVPELVYADGTPFDPAMLPFMINEQVVDGRGNVFGLAGNKYGWMVEVDPADGNDYGTKHTWLGRFRHEAVAFKVVSGKPLAVYSGCDRQGGHLYKFVSQDRVNDPTDKANSRLMTQGMLYAAVFEPDGTGYWIALAPTTPVNPVLPSTVAGSLVTLPKRPQGGIIEVTTDAEALAFKRQFATLGNLYQGNDIEKQGAILIDAHFAANTVGATPTARPEDTEMAADGSLYITFTSGSPGRDGGPDKRVFKGPKGESPWEYGWILRLVEDQDDPAAMTFRWESFAMGGEPSEGGAGFSNPDNLAFDKNGNVWMVTDIATAKHNQPIVSRVNSQGQSISQTDIQGVFGNNSIWCMPTSGAMAGNAYLFGIGPMECETTGPFFSPDQKTLFLAVQHPGEKYGIRNDYKAETRQFVIKTTDGKEFLQERHVPLGSNWPTKGINEPPLPAVVAIRRLDNQPITVV